MRFNFVFVSKTICATEEIGAPELTAHIFLEDNSGTLQGITKDSVEPVFTMDDHPRVIPRYMRHNIKTEHSN